MFCSHRGRAAPDEDCWSFLPQAACTTKFSLGTLNSHEVMYLRLVDGQSTAFFRRGLHTTLRCRGRGCAGPRVCKYESRSSVAEDNLDELILLYCPSVYGLGGSIYCLLVRMKPKSTAPQITLTASEAKLTCDTRRSI